MLKKILILSFIIPFLSCERKENTYYQNGGLYKSYNLHKNKLNGIYKEYYPNGNLKVFSIYKSGKLADSSVFYNDNRQVKEIQYYLKDNVISSKQFINNVLSSEGKYFNKQKRGRWVYYKDGKIEKVFEYVDLCGLQYTNQVWYYTDGKPNYTLGNYYQLTIPKDIYKLNEIIDLKITYKPILFINSNSLICMSPKLNGNFCNLSTVKLDTIYSENHIFNIQITFSSPGNKNLRGYIKEYYNKEVDIKDTTTYGERLLYFDIPIKIE